MKLIIDIPDKDYEKLKDGHIPFSILDIIQNGAPIPERITNGDMLKAIFPNIQVFAETDANYPYVDVFLTHDFDKNCYRKDWWNAPYRKSDNSEYLGGELYDGEFENR